MCHLKKKEKRILNNHRLSATTKLDSKQSDLFLIQLYLFQPCPFSSRVSCQSISLSNNDFEREGYQNLRRIPMK